jgi:CheY-like chemotaxis protein
MVYGFVKQSGGHIKIYSEEGHGTSIKLYVPRAPAPPDERVEAPSHIESGHETVLLVEDDKLVRTAVTAQLANLGYATLTAANAAEALALVDQGAEFDLLLTDIVMPGGTNGRQLAEQIIARRPTIKVLFASGYAENAVTQHGRLEPGVLLLSKPFRMAELARMVRTALER